MDGGREGGMEGWEGGMEGWDGWMDGWTDGRTYGWMDGQIKAYLASNSLTNR